MSHASALRRPLRVKFVNGGEEGVDQGGLQKELFQMAAYQLFNPIYGMFLYDEETRVTLFNEDSLEPEDQYELVGAFLGLAFYNGAWLDVGFPMAFEAKLLGRPLTLALLHDFAPEIARGLQQLLDWPHDDVESIFCLTFSVDVMHFGKRITESLVINGENLSVTNANRHDFVQLYIGYMDRRYFGTRFEAFRRGFSTVCDLPFISSLFEPKDLYWAMRGSTELDFKILEQNTTYEDGFTRDHPVIRSFWDVIHAMTPEQQREFLRFVTASDRTPPRGLQDVRFSIQRNGPDTDRLPSAYTCFGRLLLPEYNSVEKLQEKLIIAIHNYAGFGLV
ncbi:hypothetical protein BDF19DRAFT_246119 [Syncephalis fuscata]|nr:hypothetical protein BDF19DRAFT_246119 [Syncephalis fuscata]